MTPSQSEKPARTSPRFRPQFRKSQKQADAGVSAPAQPPETRLTITFEIFKEQAPALRSALEEISDAVAKRAEGAYDYDIEDALVRAMSGLGVLRAAVFAQVPAGDPMYRRRKS